MSSTLTIEELTGRKRRLELRGSGLPVRGAAWSGETTVATEFYPGNREGTQHVLAATEGPSEWEGVWRTTQLLRDPAAWSDGGSWEEVGFPHVLVEIMDSIRREGQLLRVTWAGRSPEPASGGTPARDVKIVRTGRLVEFEHRWDRVDDVAWSVSFAWVGRGESPATLQTTPPDVTAAIRKAILSNEGVASRVRGVAVPTRFSLGQVEALLDGPKALLDSFARNVDQITGVLGDVGGLILKARDIPASLLGRCTDTAIGAVGVANDFVDKISRLGPEALTTRTKLSLLTASASYYGDAQTQAAYMAGVNAELRDAAKRRSNAQRTAGGAPLSASAILAVHIPRDGETIDSIARRYYGAGTDLGAELARANGLSGYAVKPPRIPLVVPTLDALRAHGTRSV